MKKFYVTHNSCFNSSYDLNVVKEGLRRQGHVIVTNPSEADEIIFSGCAVHATWVDDLIRQVNQLASLDRNKKIIITGCVVGIDAEKVRTNTDCNNLFFNNFSEILGTYTNYNFVKLDKEFIQDETETFEDEGEFGQLRKRVGKLKLDVVDEFNKIDLEYKTNLAQLYKNSTKGFIFYHEEKPVEFITISRSCLYKCSYCAIPQGRGPYTSVPSNIVINKAKAALSRGVKKVLLLGDEVGNYGVDLEKTNLAELIDSILMLDKDLKIGIRYIEPTPFIKNYELFDRHCTDGRIFLIYLPLQTGSQKILRAMNRNYSISDVSEKCKQLVEKTNTIFYSNWIVGFPTETDSDFQDTINLARFINFNVNSAIPYSERPNTKSLLIPEKVSDDVINDRLKQLRNVLVELKINRFQNATKFLENARRSQILQKIEAAEIIDIKETPNLNLNS